GITMNRKLAPLTLVLILLFSMAPLTSGSSNGIYNQGSGCGGGYCHGSNTNAVVSMSGQPASYTPGQTYTLSISVTGGASATQGGFSLDVSTGTLSAGGIGIMAVKVNSGGTSATHTTNSYRSWSVDWIAPPSGSGVAIFDLAGNAADGNGGNGGDNWDAISIQIPEVGAPSNNPPTASNLQLSPSNPVTTDTLSLTYSYQDPDGDTESGTTIHWYKDGVLESSRNNLTTVPSSLTTKGESWNVTVIPSDGMDDGNAIDSYAIGIDNSIPTVLSASITPYNATESDDLTLGWSSADADNDVLSSAIEWYVDDSKVSAFDNDVTIPSVAIRDGDVWYAKIRVNDGEADSAWLTTQTITIGSDNTPPTMTSVSLSGPYTTVDDLVATALANDDDNDQLTYEWEWTGTLFTSDTLPASQTNKGESWSVRCRVTDGSAYSAWMESNSVTIQNTAPVLLSLSIEQETIFFESEATYVYEASDVDGDSVYANEIWSLDGDVLTLTLSVSDTDMSQSASLSDSVIIVNSPPTASYDGATTQDALTNLNPTVTTSDANSDLVTVSWQWARNGFTTDYNQSFIPSSSLGAGDVWIALVTPNDGIDDGQVLVIEITISNTDPVAVITSPESLVQGSMVTFSADQSTDVDGAVVNAIWSIDDVVVHNGMSFTTMMSEQITVQLKAIDDMGAMDSISQTFNGELPPYATEVEVSIDGTEVVITWEGAANEWAVLHNGEVIGITAGKSFRHSPTMEGTHTYNVIPIVDGQQIQWESDESTDSVELDSNIVPEKPGPSETAGMIFSIILLLAGITGVALSFIPRRD
ncbi:MAG: choice-of-anchor V domain-containing protein, partial [Candidatus Poseidoniaceae archaeon]